MRRERKRWPVELKDELMAQQGGMCCICGEPCDWTTFNGTYASYPTFEHVVPLKDGGADELHNLGISHRGCNGDRDSDAGSAQDPQGLDPEGAAARPEGIAQ